MFLCLFIVIFLLLANENITFKIKISHQTNKEDI